MVDSKCSSFEKREAIEGPYSESRLRFETKNALTYTARECDCKFRKFNFDICYIHSLWNDIRLYPQAEYLTFTFCQISNALYRLEYSPWTGCALELKSCGKFTFKGVDYHYGSLATEAREVLLWWCVGLNHFRWVFANVYVVELPWVDGDPASNIVRRSSRRARQLICAFSIHRHWIERKQPEVAIKRRGKGRSPDRSVCVW